MTLVSEDLTFYDVPLKLCDPLRIASAENQIEAKTRKYANSRRLKVWLYKLITGLPVVVLFFLMLVLSNNAFGTVSAI